MLELYQKEECPFCHKVRVALNDLGLDFICRISKTGLAQREIMLKLGGKSQVPFLVDQEKGVMLYESDDIVFQGISSPRCPAGSPAPWLSKLGLLIMG